MPRLSRAPDLGRRARGLRASTRQTARRLVAQLARLRGGCARVLPAARALGPRRRAAADAGRRQAALRRAADRVETALAGLEEPLKRYLFELEAEIAPRAGPGTAGPGAGELVDWEPVLSRAGVHAAPERVAQAYLELAVLVRALEGLTTAARIDAAPNRSSLWAGLFDLRENLLGRALDDLRALAVA